MDRDENLCDNNCNKGYKFGIVPDIQVTVSGIFLLSEVFGDTTAEVCGLRPAEVTLNDNQSINVSRKCRLLKICHYFCISAHSQCTDQEYTAQVNGEVSA